MPNIIINIPIITLFLHEMCYTSEHLCLKMPVIIRSKGLHPLSQLNCVQEHIHVAVDC